MRPIWQAKIVTKITTKIPAQHRSATSMHFESSDLLYENKRILRTRI
jgi:hypothetical protein